MARSSRRSLVFVLLVLLCCGILGAVFGQRVGAAAADSDADVRDGLRDFSQVYNIVEQNYAEPVEAQKAIYDGAIPGMLRVLDPHSSFFDPKAYALLREDQSGKYYGVGMSIVPRNGKVVVLAPFVGTPAYRAGIRPGDVIVAVDGKPTENLDSTAVADMLKGPKGTTVHITIAREGADKPLQFTVVRDEIPHYSVDVHFMIKPGIGYLHVAQFNETTDQEVRDALNQMGNLQGLLLDLRQNPGGLLTEAVEVADKFLPKGDVIVSHHGRASQEKVYRATHGDGGHDYPIVVLVDRGTASAAEIVSGALQDHDRALIVGETTFGKGLVQTVYPLSDNTGLALTTARYYTPSGRLIQRNYEGVSLYDYYNDRGTVEKGNHEVKLTDSGRTVYGGGGITPDEKIPPIKPTSFQDSLLEHYAFFNFAKHYLVSRHVDRNFQVDDAVMQDFRRFLDEEKIPFTEADIAQAGDWIKSNIKAELFISEFGWQAGLQVRAESDPAVMKALEYLPEAKALVQKAERVVAQREASHLTQ